MSGPAATPVVILCGGRGTRPQEHAALIPKPLVELGGLPVVPALGERVGGGGFCVREKPRSEHWINGGLSAARGETARLGQR